MKHKKVRPIAFVLPQFHPIPENDEWWGKGFTEWTNVTKAKPLYKGHYQPQLPTELGFYDLRLPEARKAQADLAREHGISGFCYYHYWFNGKRLLDQPIDGMLGQKDLDMPFMLCWANENWTRRWDGLDEDILIKQEYSFEDDKEHIRWLCEKIFPDERYIRVNDCPVFAIYRHNLFPDIKKTAELWRKIAKEEYGFKDLYLMAVENFNEVFDPGEINFEAAIEFSPHRVCEFEIPQTGKERLSSYFGRKKTRTFNFTDYSRAVKNCLNRKEKRFKLFRSVTPAWDNTARKKQNALIARGSSPKLYHNWLKNTIRNFEPYSEDENFVFINAMNEWAEGNHLEPCIKYGRKYLEATKTAIENKAL